MKWWKLFVSSCMAGICIAFGGTVFLSLENKVLGAAFFTVGLFTVCTFRLCLFTGRVCYILERDREYLLGLPLIWLGNLAGTALTAALVGMTRIASIGERAAQLCRVKLDDSLLSVFLLAVMCNIFIYIGVEGFQKNPHELGKYLSLFFGVMVFILCGFEHCVANMFYFSMAGMWSGKTVLYLLVMTAGNAVGGIGFAAVRGWLIRPAAQ